MPELSPGGSKREGKNDREPKHALYIITEENQAKNKILYLAGALSEAKHAGRRKPLKNHH